LGASAKANGMANYQDDDPNIPDIDRLFRRVRPNQLFTEPDGSQRPTSAVFKNPELSVNIESLMVEQGRPPEDALTNFPNEFLTSILAANVRAYRYPIVKDTAPPNDPAHGLVLGRKTNAFANAMVRTQHWIIPPPKE
jgi:hypothetical protein